MSDDFSKRSLDSSVEESSKLTSLDVQYLRKILSAHIAKLKDATLFDDELQKKSVDFSKGLLSKLDNLDKPGKMVFSHLSKNTSVDQVLFMYEGKEVARLLPLS